MRKFMIKFEVQELVKTKLEKFIERSLDNKSSIELVQPTDSKQIAGKLLRTCPDYINYSNSTIRFKFVTTRERLIRPTEEKFYIQICAIFR